METGAPRGCPPNPSHTLVSTSRPPEDGFPALRVQDRDLSARRLARSQPPLQSLVSVLGRKSPRLSELRESRLEGFKSTLPELAVVPSGLPAVFIPPKERFQIQWD